MRFAADPKKEGFVMYKSQLQEYAQKAGLMHPTYDHVKEGASHEPRFKSTVWVNNQSYESAPGFSTIRSAEHAAAKVALDFLQKSQTTSGLVPSPVHESGLCKNLLQEYAQKKGFPLPQYKLMRQGEEHSRIFTATVEIAGVSYSGGGAKSKKEAEIKAARTALLAIQATQPAAAMGLPAMEPRPPLALPQSGQVVNFVKSRPKRKKRGRSNAPLIEEPLATRMKQCLGHVPGLVPLPQIHQVHQVHEMPQVSGVSPMAQVLDVSQVYQMPQVPQSSHVLHVSPLLNQVPHPLPVNPVGYPGQNVMPVEWNQKIGAAVAFSEPMQVGNVVSQDSAMTARMEPTLDTKVFNVENHLITAVGNTETGAVVEAHVTTVKPESAEVQQVPLTMDTGKDSEVFGNIILTETTNSVPKEKTDCSATTGLKEIVTLTEVHVSPASTSEVLSVQPQVSTLVQEELPAFHGDQVAVPITEITTKNISVNHSE